MNVQLVPNQTFIGIILFNFYLSNDSNRCKFSFFLTLLILLLCVLFIHTLYKIYNNILFGNICLRVSHIVIPRLTKISPLKSSGRWLGLLGQATLNMLACWIPSYNMVVLQYLMRIQKFKISFNQLYISQMRSIFFSRVVFTRESLIFFSNSQRLPEPILNAKTRIYNVSVIPELFAQH